MALHGLYCADVPLRNCSHPVTFYNKIRHPSRHSTNQQSQRTEGFVIYYTQYHILINIHELLAKNHYWWKRVNSSQKQTI